MFEVQADVWRPPSGKVAYGVYDSILETIGNTPLVRLHTVSRGYKPTILAKVELFNPGGSVKDRIGVTIVEDYEKRGLLKAGGTIVEATSGNTGVGLAIAAAIKGYKSVFVMPDKMSDEKVRLLRAFGARVVITPTAVAPEDPRSYYNVAKQIVKETPGAVLANQYHNMINPISHYYSTGPELWEGTEGRITHFVAGLGTGGTISGTGKYLKEQNPAIQIIGVDPIGSLLHEFFYTGNLGEAFSYKVEGIGEDFVPGTTDFDYVDDVVQVDDRESLLMTRRLVREEGIFCGGSCGSAVAGALKVAKSLSEDAVVVVLLPDSGSRYLSKVFNDDWMRENRFLDYTPLGEGRVGDLLMRNPRDAESLILAHPHETKIEIIQRMKDHNVSQLPVVGDGERYIGVVTERDLLNHLLSANHDHARAETIEDVINNEIPLVGRGSALDTLAEAFAESSVVVVVDAASQVEGIVTKIDLIDYLSQRLN
ncbi:MAG: cystathionine beta-synthase [Anaerolineales bacterium]|nr:cystathionine beta-synthase [Anaerolineales bacterium]MCB9171438.1 cystathionine beta-synthase [Ardenticatenales bacterium]